MKNLVKVEILNSIKNIEVKKTISKFLDGLVSIEKCNRSFYISDFFSQSELNFICSILKKLSIKFDIIFPISDYDRNLIVISYQEYDLMDNIDILKIQDIKNIGHRNILGSILNLGINRSKIGDIIKFENFWYIYCLKPIGEFIFSNGLYFFGTRAKIEILDKLFIPKGIRKFIEEKIIVSSFRIDCLVKELSKTSREEAKNKIKNSFVKVNYNECKDFDKKINVEDILSIKKIGKFKIDSIIGITKKDKYIINVKRYSI